MKKIFALLLTTAILASAMVVPSFAAVEKIAGGFDFYSMTIHYTEPVVVDYVKVSKSDKIQMVDKNGQGIVDEEGNPVYLSSGYVFAEAKSQYVVNMAETKENQHMNYNGTVASSAGDPNVNYIMSSDLGIDSGNLVYNKGLGIANITNNTVLATRESVSMYAVDRYYDDAGNRNPNLEFSNGYFIDVSGARIDDNGFIIDDNNLWHDSDGRRIEPFVEIDGKLHWIDVASRLDSNGMVIDYKNITNATLIEKGMVTLPEEYKLADAEFDESYDYNGDGKVFSATNSNKDRLNDRQSWKSLADKKATWLAAAEVMLYRVDFQDTNGDGKKTEDDLAAYNDPTRKFTEEDILVKVIAGKESKVNGSPVIGKAKSKAQIAKITVEIDALGTSTYADVASDPQQKNEIIITTGDVYENVKAALDHVAVTPNAVYTEGSILGTAKSVTTKTEMGDTSSRPETVTSVEVVLAEGVEIPANANLYFNFKVQELQPEDAANFKTKSGTSQPYSINREKLDTTKIPIVTPEPTAEPEKKGCGSVIGGSVATVCVLAAFIFLKKKEDR